MNPAGNPPDASAPTSRSARYRRVMEAMIIADEAGRLVPMRFTPSQELLWKAVAPRLDAHERLWFVVLKGRQVYATTFFTALAFVRTMERANTSSVIIAQEIYSAADIFRRARRFYEHLPLPRLRPSRVSEIEFQLPDGSSWLSVASAGKVGKGRGTTKSVVLASEVAYWTQPEVLVGLFQAVPDLPDTVWILESTANGMVGLGQPFYEQWKAAVDGRSKLIPLFIPWYVVPKYHLDPPLPEDEWDDDEKLLVEAFGAQGCDGRALAWRRFVIGTKLQGSRELFDQEFPSTPEVAFLSSGLPAFDARAVLRQQRWIRPPRLCGMMGENGRFSPAPRERAWLHIWEEPRDGHQYVIGVDTAEGIRGGDYACAQILDMGELEQVAIIHGHIEPWELARQLAAVGKWYNQALIAVEVQSTGRAVQDYLIRVFQYPNLHVWRGRADTIRRPAAQLYGWETNVYSRPLLIEAGRRAINSGLVILHDRSTLDEIARFSRLDNGRYAASVGHDDRVLALLIALRSREENYAPARSVSVSAASEYQLSDPLPSGVRVVHSAEQQFVMRKEIHAALVRRARSAVDRSWMSL